MSVALAIHGGAGEVRGERIEALRADAEAALAVALERGRDQLKEHSSAQRAVVAAVSALEEAPCFNAGRGAVLTEAGHVELSASLMVGRTLAAGAIAGFRRTRHPIRAAELMLEQRHTVVAGIEAEERLRERYDLEHAEPSSFITAERKAQWLELLNKGEIALDHESQTVGAVARDLAGDVAAATSTGGLSCQWPGRVPDTSVPGSGTWADNRTVAVSATGDGDVFLRHGFARRVADLVDLEAISPQRACDIALVELQALGGYGGCLAVASAGPPVLRMNTSGMFRGLLAEDGRIYVAIARGEALHPPGAKHF